MTETLKEGDEPHNWAILCCSHEALRKHLFKHVSQVWVIDVFVLVVKVTRMFSTILCTESVMCLVQN